jgi:hypothetical protein
MLLLLDALFALSHEHLDVLAGQVDPASYGPLVAPAVLLLSHFPGLVYSRL